MKDTVKKSENSRLIKSISLFLVSYFVLIALVFVMIVLNDVETWQTYLRDHVTDMLLLVVSIFFLFGIIFFYFLYEDPYLLLKGKDIALVFTLIIFSIVICYVFGRYVHIYARPLAMFAFLAYFLINRRHALVLNFVFIFLVFVIDLFTNTFPDTSINVGVYMSLMLGFVSGMFAIFFAGTVKTRGGLMLRGVFIAVPTVAVVLLFNIPDFANNDWINYVSDAGFRLLGCIISAVLALAFLPVFESMFNRLTVFRLRELTSTDAALLVRLKKEAPGTFNHSLIVAQLAESCAVAIGDNAELARTAAYYHDVGKLKQPDCFTENQADYNLHDEITPELSADIIRSHTKDGYDLLIANKLPKEIANVAREHHGTLPIKYFYDKAVRYSGDANIKDFSYLGPVPKTKISAIIMISDAVEAATRAAQDRSPERVEKICRSIIEERMDLGQFDECDITLNELSIIKQTLVEALSGVHHQRVTYPSIQFNRDRKAVRTEEDRNV